MGFWGLIMGIISIGFFIVVIAGAIQWIKHLSLRASSSIEKDSLKKAEIDAQAYITHPYSSVSWANTKNETEKMKIALSLGVCFSRMAIRVAAADDNSNLDIKLNTIIEYFQGASQNFIDYIAKSLANDIKNIDNIDWNYNTKVLQNILSQEEYRYLDVVIFDGLLYIALSDGEISEEELETIILLMLEIGWDQQKIHNHLNSLSGLGIDHDKPQEEQELEAIHILGLDVNATLQEIKKRYRLLAKQNHPDVFASLGTRAEEDAAKRFIAINEAYEYLLLSMAE